MVLITAHWGLAPLNRVRGRKARGLVAEASQQRRLARTRMPLLARWDVEWGGSRVVEVKTPEIGRFVS